MKETTIKLFELLNYKSLVCKAKCQAEYPCVMYCNQFEQEVLENAIKQLQQANINLTSTKCPICGEGFLNAEGLKMHEQLIEENKKIKQRYSMDLKIRLKNKKYRVMKQKLETKIVNLKKQIEILKSKAAENKNT